MGERKASQNRCLSQVTPSQHMLIQPEAPQVRPQWATPWLSSICLHTGLPGSAWLLIPRRALCASKIARTWATGFSLTEASPPTTPSQVPHGQVRHTVRPLALGLLLPRSVHGPARACPGGSMQRKPLLAVSLCLASGLYKAACTAWGMASGLTWRHDETGLSTQLLWVLTEGSGTCVLSRDKR